MFMKKQFSRFIGALLATVSVQASSGIPVDTTQLTRPADTMNSVPAGILTPSSVETRLGKLTFENGMPSEDTAQRAYDNLDFQRGVNAFLDGIPLASIAALKTGLKSIGASNNALPIFANQLDSRSLFLTANTESIYGLGWLDLKATPLIVETPKNVLGFINNAAFLHVGDVGNAGPDKGKGGKYLLVGPEWNGKYNPDDYTAVYQSTSYGNWIVLRGFLGNDKGQTAVNNISNQFKVYPLGDKAKNIELLNVSGVKFNTVHSNDFDFYKEIDSMVQYEHKNFLSPERLGLLNSIGIIKGVKFNPDARMKSILTESAAVGNATARAQLFQPRNKKQFIYPDKQWFNAYGNSGYDMTRDSGGRDLDARTKFHLAFTGVSPAMDLKLVGAGSQYGIITKDQNSQSFNGSNTYRLRIRANVPAKNFWSVVLYDVQHRSMLRTDQLHPSITSYTPKLTINDDQSIDLYFGPSKPNIEGVNWIKTDPEANWFGIFRLYGPEQAWFDKTWQLNDIEKVN